MTAPAPGAGLAPEGMAGLLARLDADLAATDALLAARYGGRAGRVGSAPVPQPVHTVYVPADRVDATTPSRWGEAALALLDEVAPDPASLARATGLAPAAVEAAWPPLRAVLAGRPVADLRIDLEDGYGPHADDEEDADASHAGVALAELAGAAARGEAGAPLLAGVRIRSLEAATRARSLRTLDVVLRSLAQEVRPVGDGVPVTAVLPERVVVTLAKVSAPAQVAALVTALDALEAAHGLPAGTVAVEVQVEVPALVVAADGTAAVAGCLTAGAGRVSALHYGTYDFSAACGVPPAAQALDHPLADHAKDVLQLVAAGTGVHVSDGSTNVVPTGTPEAVASAWALHARLVTRALQRGLAQGWDLHPGHLVTRHLANLVFYAEAAPEAVRRLGEWARSAAGSESGGVMDEPATAQAMATLLVRGAAAGALDLAAAAAAAGVPLERVRSLAARRVA